MSGKLLLFMFALLLSIPLHATTITFEGAGLIPGFGPHRVENPKGTLLPFNSLTTLGANFTSYCNTGGECSNHVFIGGVGFVNFAPGPLPIGNFLTVLNNPIGALGDWSGASLHFTEPGNVTNPATTPGSSIGFDVYDGNTLGVTVRSYNSSGGLLETLSLPGLTPFIHLNFSLGDVNRIDFEDTGADGFVVDNIVFGDLRFETQQPNAVPEPGTCLLFGLGLSVLGVIRLRR